MTKPRISLEFLARHHLTRLGARPCDAVDVAERAGLELNALPGFERRGSVDPLRGWIFYDPSTSPERAHAVIAHEVAHWILHRAGMPHDEADAWRLGAALLVPRAALLAALEQNGPDDLEAIREAFPNASRTLLARRIAEVCGGRFSSWHHEKLARSAGYGPRGPSTALRRIVRLAGLYRAPRGFGATGEPMARAWPIGDGWTVAVEI
jgi:hypothetical protein